MDSDSWRIARCMRARCWRPQRRHDRLQCCRLVAIQFIRARSTDTARVHASPQRVPGQGHRLEKVAMQWTVTHDAMTVTRVRAWRLHARRRHARTSHRVPPPLAHGCKGCASARRHTDACIQRERARATACLCVAH